MSRAIKFRAWSLLAREMYKVNSLHFDREGLSEIVVEVFEVDGVIYSSAIARNLELMQFTGLKDVHGTDIYENDIVKNVAYRFNSVVFFDRGSFWARECFSNVDEGLYDDREKETRWSIDLDWEVIGNIYEHVELLESKA